MSAPRFERCAVTGATGYIGRTLVETLLEAGHEVTAVVRDERRARRLLPAAGSALELRTSDLTSPGAAPDLTGCEALFHLAASLDMFGAPHQEELNVTATQEVGRAAKAAGVRRMVFASSLEASGVTAPNQARTEQELGQHAPYGLSKLRAERRLRELAAAGGPEVVAARIGIVFGGQQDLWTPGLLRLLRSQQASWLPLLEDIVVDCIHVQDVAAGLLALLHADAEGSFRTFHLTGGPLRLREVFGAVRQAAGLAEPTAFADHHERQLAAQDLRNHIEQCAAQQQADLLTYLAWPEPARASRWLSRTALDAATTFRPSRAFQDEVGGIIERVLSVS